MFERAVEIRGENVDDSLLRSCAGIGRADLYRLRDEFHNYPQKVVGEKAGIWMQLFREQMKAQRYGIAAARFDVGMCKVLIEPLCLPRRSEFRKAVLLDEFTGIFLGRFLGKLPKLVHIL